MRFWVEVIDRTWDTELNKPSLFHAVMFEKDMNAMGDDPWHIKEDRKKLRTAKGDNRINLIDGLDKKLKIYQQCSSFKSYFSFPPLPDDWWLAYKRISDVRKLDPEAVNVASKWERAVKALCWYLCEEHKPHFTQQGVIDAMKVLGGDNIPSFSNQDVSNWLSKIKSKS